MYSIASKAEALKELEKYNRGYIVCGRYSYANDLSEAWDEAIKANRDFVLRDYKLFKMEHLIVVKENGKILQEKDLKKDIEKRDEKLKDLEYKIVSTMKELYLFSQNYAECDLYRIIELKNIDSKD